MPRCFVGKRNEPPGKQTTQEWLTFSSEHVGGRTSRKVDLLMDHCGPHDLVYAPHNVEIFKLLPNCTYLHQPMDAGIESRFSFFFTSSLHAFLVFIASSLSTCTLHARRCAPRI